MINIEKYRSKTMKRSLLLRAEFLAAVQVIVHAGAILVFYLFVLMLITPSLAAQRSGRAGPGNLGDRCCPVIPPRQILVRVLRSKYLMCNFFAFSYYLLVFLFLCSITYLIMALLMTVFKTGNTLKKNELIYIATINCIAIDIC